MFALELELDTHRLIKVAGKDQFLHSNVMICNIKLLENQSAENVDRLIARKEQKQN